MGTLTECVYAKHWLTTVRSINSIFHLHAWCSAQLTPLSREGSARASEGVTPNWLRADVKAALVGTKTVATRVGSLR